MISNVEYVRTLRRLRGAVEVELILYHQYGVVGVFLATIVGILRFSARFAPLIESSRKK